MIERKITFPMKAIHPPKKTHVPRYHTLRTSKLSQHYTYIFIRSNCDSAGCAPNKSSVIRRPSMLRSSGASHRNRCDLVMLDLPSGADDDLVHGPHGPCRARQAKLAAVLRDRRHLVQLLDDEAAPCRVSAASRYLSKLVAWGCTHRHTLKHLKLSGWRARLGCN